MNDVDELKDFGLTHARAQHIPARVYRRVCRGITSDADGNAGSWAARWSAEAGRLEAAGRLADACAYYNLARFPYVDGPARDEAMRNCAATFARWAATKPGIERLDLDLADGRVRCWTAGLSAAEPRPLLLVLGGIVSVKEQWAPILAQVGRLGMAGVVAELPGVGENTTRYTADSWRLIPAILDAVAGVADVAQTYALALSFSGHLTLRCAARDPRLRGVVTAGAPISGFFTDPQWQARIPRITVATLAHLTGTDPASAVARMSSWRLTDDELGSLSVPLYYVVSRKDTVVPPGEADHLRRHVRDLTLLEYNEDHGSPRYAAETRAWIFHSILRMRGGHPVQRAVVGTVLGALRGRRRLVEA